MVEVVELDHQGGPVPGFHQIPDILLVGVLVFVGEKVHSVQDILINMTVVPLEPVFALPYGIFYRSNPTAAARKFMDFIRKTYEEGNSAGIVPILG